MNIQRKKEIVAGKLHFFFEIENFLYFSALLN